jgi:DNA-binding response OmpR family regulator
MMTALSQESDRARGESLGANKYLIKSQVTLEDVVNSVKEQLSGGGNASTPPPAPPAPPAPPTATPPKPAA